MNLTMQTHLPDLLNFMYGSQVLLEKDVSGNLHVFKWDVPTEGQPQDLQAFFDANKHHLFDKIAADLRDYRTKLLAATDWAMLEDAPISNELKLLYKNYRQGLRDLSKQPGFATGDIEWPAIPSKYGVQLTDKSSDKDLKRAKDIVDSQSLGEEPVIQAEETREEIIPTSIDEPAIDTLREEVPTVDTTTE